MKGGVTTVQDEDQAWTLVCVLCAAVVREGLPLYFCVCLFLLNFFKCSPVPASFFPIGTNVTQFVDREEGGGNRRTFKEFNNTNK